MLSMNPTEAKTKKYFEKSGFHLIRIPESDTKTPDFTGDRILVEVKKIVPEERECLSNDSTYNAVKNNLKDASRKFRAYDPHHSKKHLVIIYSEEIVKDDIYSVWTGEWSREHRDRIFKGGMLLSSSHKEHIDAIAWFEKDSDNQPRFVWAMGEDLKQYFPEINP